MIPQTLSNPIIRLFFVEKWPIGTVARHLNVHHSTVTRALEHHGVPAEAIPRRSSKIDPFRAFLVETLEKWPGLPASRVYGMVCGRGYVGGPDHFRAYVRRLRPKATAEAFLRLRTLPGDEAQVDWAHFGMLQVDGTKRPLVAFVMVLSWSRRIFLRFGLDMRTGAFLAYHVAAFEVFGGVARAALYDKRMAAPLNPP